MTRAAIPLIVLTVLVMLFWYGLQLDPTEVPSPLIDKPAPSFQLESVGDPSRSVSLAEFSGEPVLVNVWGSWCVGCHEEHAMLMRIAETSGIPILGINWKDARDDALGFLDEYGDPYAVSGWDYEGDVAIDWGVYGAPETFIVDGEGIIRYKHIGPITPQAWEQEIRPRLQALEGAG